MPKTLSVEQQIGKLRPSVKIGFAGTFHWWFMGIAVALVILSIALQHPVPFAIACFFGIIGLAERQTGPNIVAAITAYDAQHPTIGEVSITISCWDEDNHYYALVSEKGQPDWEYEFMPQGWQPAAGTYPARIWHLDGHVAPVLVAVEHGILIPRNNPKPPKSKA